MSDSFHIVTFGCRTNQADSTAIREDLLARAVEEASDFKSADVVIINSCTVTQRSDQQVRQLTRRVLRANPEAAVVVTGCYAQREPKALAAIPGVGAVVGNTHKNEVADIASELLAKRQSTARVPRILRDAYQKTRIAELVRITEPVARTRPFVKIQDGCDAKCAYCIVPTVRGPGRSVPPEQVLREVASLVSQGYREIVLTGIHLGTYGLHLRPRFTLDRLLEEIVAIPGLGRVRLSSIEPMELSRRAIEVARGCPQVAPHFHVCLQSGSDSVLKRMLRPYTTSKFAQIIEEIWTKIPGAGIGTDLIAGFPGESEAEHRETVRFVERMPFTYLHVFPYSDRSGTRAHSMADKVEPQRTRGRSEELRLLSEQKNAAFRRTYWGREIKVLTLGETRWGCREAISGNYLKALVSAEIPENTIFSGTVEAEEQGYLRLGPPAESILQGKEARDSCREAPTSVTDSFPG